MMRMLAAVVVLLVLPLSASSLVEEVPFVTTPDEGFPAGVDWEGLVSHAAENTTLYPGDLIVR